MKYDLKFLEDAKPSAGGNRITLPSRFDRRQENWIKRHWEYTRWQRYNHPPKQTQLNKFAISHGFIYFHPLMYNGYFTKNKNLTKTYIRYTKPKRRFKQKFEDSYQEQR